VKGMAKIPFLLREHEAFGAALGCEVAMDGKQKINQSISS
jgi:hypothetical protein